VNTALRRAAVAFVTRAFYLMSKGNRIGVRRAGTAGADDLNGTYVLWRPAANRDYRLADREGAQKGVLA
jgi:hypothetical protein